MSEEKKLPDSETPPTPDDAPKQYDVEAGHKRLAAVLEGATGKQEEEPAVEEPEADPSPGQVPPEEAPSGEEPEAGSAEPEEDPEKEEHKRKSLEGRKKAAERRKQEEQREERLMAQIEALSHKVDALVNAQPQKTEADILRELGIEDPDEPVPAGKVMELMKKQREQERQIEEERLRKEEASLNQYTDTYLEEMKELVITLKESDEDNPVNAELADEIWNLCTTKGSDFVRRDVEDPKLNARMLFNEAKSHVLEQRYKESTTPKPKLKGDPPPPPLGGQSKPGGGNPAETLHKTGNEYVDGYVEHMRRQGRSPEFINKVVGKKG